MLEEVKSRLRITWNDEDAMVQSMIESGKSRLESLTGTTLDFTKGQPRELLFEYCRYAYNNALEYFEENFQKEILRLQLNVGVDMLACLSDIDIEGLILSPEFDSETYEYTASTTDDSNVITAAAISEDATIEITVNGTAHENDTAYTWEPGENTVLITVTDGSSSKEYNVAVMKS